MEIVPVTASLETADPDAVSVLSWNILLPQRVDGWWVFKAYQPHIPMEQRTWSYRHALMIELLESAHADIVCVQEASEASFEEDFAFMEGSYDCVLHRKFRFRCATFWRRDRFELVEEHHGDRALVTTLRDRQGRLLHLVNCHLSGGPVPERRFRQVFDALDRVRKIRGRLEDASAEPAVVVCGDMNSFPGDTALERLLDGEVIGSEYRQPGYPERRISSKNRQQPFGTLSDVALRAFTPETRPSTYIVTELADRFHDAEDQPTQGFLEALDQMFDALTNGSDTLDEAGIDAWIEAINEEPGRGSEWRKACEAMGDTGVLTRAQFRDVYLSEAQERKYWAVQHDLARFGLALPEGRPGPCAVCIDRIYASQALEPVIWRRSLTPEQRDALFEGGESLPGPWHPSDHLPVACVVRWATSSGSAGQA